MRKLRTPIQEVRGDGAVAVLAVDIFPRRGNHGRALFLREVERSVDRDKILLFRTVLIPKLVLADTAQGLDDNGGLAEAFLHDHADVVDPRAALSDPAKEETDEAADKPRPLGQKNISRLQDRRHIASPRRRSS